VGPIIMLVWNQYEFIECLGVLPVVGEHEISHSFEIEKDGLKLELTLYQYDGDVYVDLYREGIEVSIFSARLIDCPGARYVKYANGSEYLEFAAAKSFGSRYDDESAILMGIRLAVHPHIRIEIF
jgi:hypothetical protein